MNISQGNAAFRELMLAACVVAFAAAVVLIVILIFNIAKVLKVKKEGRAPYKLLKYVLLIVVAVLFGVLSVIEFISLLHVQM